LGSLLQKRFKIANAGENVVMSEPLYTVGNINFYHMEDSMEVLEKAKISSII
jgi:hypothetical protein